VLIVEKTDEEIEGQVDIWGEAGSAKPLMDRIKSQLDPRGILPHLQFGV